MAGELANVVGPIAGSRFYLTIDNGWLARVGGTSDAWESPLGKRLAVSFYDLEEGLEESSDVNYTEGEPILGRAEGYKSYVGTGNKTIPLNFKFQAQGGGSGTTRDKLQREVVDPARWLEALKYPYKSPSGISYSPPRVQLYIGDLLRARCIADEVSIRWGSPFDPDSMLPYAAEVSCSFVVVRKKITNYSFRNPSWV